MKQLIFAVLGLFMAVLPAAAQSDYHIQPGDTLSIEVLQDSSLNRSVLVAPDGRITVPLAGTMKVSGDTVDQVAALLASKLAPNYAAKPTVYVGIGSVAVPKAAASSTIDVYIIGEANKPGKYSVKRGTTILQFLAEIGGFTPFAATKRLQLRRTDARGHETLFTLNYQAVLNGGADTLNGTVDNGDVFVIPPRHLFE